MCETLLFEIYMQSTRLQSNSLQLNFKNVFEFFLQKVLNFKHLNKTKFKTKSKYKSSEREREGKLLSSKN